MDIFDWRLSGMSRVIEPIRLIETKMYSLNSALLPEILRSYDELGIKKGPLKLIQPQFETPLPGLKVAVRRDSLEFKAISPERVKNGIVRNVS